MREIQASTITDVVEKLCIEANYHLPEDVKCAITGCRACEDGEIAKGVLDKIVENYEIADAQNVPICQDTGMACVFLEIGQDGAESFRKNGTDRAAPSGHLHHPSAADRSDGRFSY